jgi:hypothetical protein
LAYDYFLNGLPKWFYRNFRSLSITGLYFQ